MREIEDDIMNAPIVVEEKLRESFALAVAKFDQQAAARLERLARPLGEGAVKIQAVGAAIQREARIVIAHLRLQQLNFTRGNVRRIGDNCLEALRWLESR